MSEFYMGPGTSLLVERSDGKILMVARRHDHSQFGLPGGKVDPEDGPLEGSIQNPTEYWERNWKTITQGAIRELREETGFGLCPSDLSMFWFGICENQAAPEGTPRFWPTWTFTATLPGNLEPKPMQGEPPAKWGSWDEVCRQGQPFHAFNRILFWAKYGYAWEPSRGHS